MQLPDWRIAERVVAEMPAQQRLVVKPWEPENLQSASLDVRLGGQVRNEHDRVWDIHSYEDMEPGRFLLGHTEEYFEIPADMCARVEGKSSIGRRGTAIHVTAGFIDPGFKGQITLELKNHATHRHFKLVPGMLIAQITFHLLQDPPTRLYGNPLLRSHYQGQLGATGPAR